MIRAGQNIPDSAYPKDHWTPPSSESDTETFQCEYCNKWFDPENIIFYESRAGEDQAWVCEDCYYLLTKRTREGSMLVKDLIRELLEADQFADVLIKDKGKCYHFTGFNINGYGDVELRVNELDEDYFFDETNKQATDVVISN